LFAMARPCSLVISPREPTAGNCRAKAIGKPKKVCCARIARGLARAFVAGKFWTDCTYSLKARKLGGAEGFLIPFNVRDENAKSWWNLGGWGNTRHTIENEWRRHAGSGIHRDRAVA